MRTNADNKQGQILEDTRLGHWLTALASASETIVEIGTWRGLGSTLCIANGLSRPSQRFFTVEQDAKVQAEAKSHYANEGRIHWIHGHALEVLHMLPASIDLLLLDGHDETTNAEFDALAPRAKIVVLDDTNEAKNKRQRDLILLKPDEWAILAHFPSDRKGWMAAMRINRRIDTALYCPL